MCVHSPKICHSHFTLYKTYRIQSALNELYSDSTYTPQSQLKCPNSDGKRNDCRKKRELAHLRFYENTTWPIFTNRLHIFAPSNTSRISIWENRHDGCLHLMLRLRAKRRKGKKKILLKTSLSTIAKAFTANQSPPPLGNQGPLRSLNTSLQSDP